MQYSVQWSGFWSDAYRKMPSIQKHAVATKVNSRKRDWRCVTEETELDEAAIKWNNIQHSALLSHERFRKFLGQNSRNASNDAAARSSSAAPMGEITSDANWIFFVFQWETFKFVAMWQRFIRNGTKMGISVGLFGTFTRSKATKWSPTL